MSALCGQGRRKGHFRGLAIEYDHEADRRGGRIAVGLDDPEVMRALRSVHVWPITAEIAKTSTRLDVLADPADGLIAATSLVHHLPLVTRDRALRRSALITLAP